MAVCTLKGYEMLGRKLSKKGIIISCILMIVMTYAGDRLDWAIVVARELAWDVFTSYQAIPWLLQEYIIEPSVYWGNLAMVYVFLLLGAVPTIISTLKNKKIQGTITRID